MEIDITVKLTGFVDAALVEEEEEEEEDDPMTEPCIELSFQGRKRKGYALNSVYAIACASRVKCSGVVYMYI